MSIRLLLTLLTFFHVSSAAAANCTHVESWKIRYLDGDASQAKQQYALFLSELKTKFDLSPDSTDIRYVTIDHSRLDEAMQASQPSLPDDACTILIPTSHALARAIIKQKVLARIVFQTQNDPDKLISIAKNSTHVTGITYHMPLHTKRLEILATAYSGINKIAVVIDKKSHDLDTSLTQHIDAFNKHSRIKANLLVVESVSEFDAMLAKHRPDAIYIPYSWFAFANKDKLISLLTKSCQRVIFEKNWYAKKGGGISYEAVGIRGHVELAMHVGWIVSQVSPAKLAVVRPYEFNTYMNLDHARKCGHDIQRHFLMLLEQ
jgi:ABC-type uncharacterized transport system substrate-binding protein